MERRKAHLVARDLQRRISQVLAQWDKREPLEDEHSIQMVWTNGQAKIVLYFFWADGNEGIRIHLLSPNTNMVRDWREVVAGAMIDSVIETAGTLATLAINLFGSV